jgi:hypothetical protein
MGISRDNKDNLSTPPQTEDSAERGFVKERPRTPEPETYEDLGQSQSEELETDGDDIGDIADEGPGHRG